MSKSKSAQQSSQRTTTTTTTTNQAASDEAIVGSGNTVSRITNVEDVSEEIAVAAIDEVGRTGRTAIEGAEIQLDRSLDFAGDVQENAFDLAEITQEGSFTLARDFVSAGQGAIDRQQDLVADLAQRTLASPQPDSEVARDLVRVGVPAAFLLVGAVLIFQRRGSK